MKHILLISFFAAFSFCSMAQEEQPRNTTPADHSRIFADQVSQKIKTTKNQKDSLNMIFMQFMDDVQKYQAHENDKVFNYLVKSRDNKVKTLLHDDAKYEKYLILMEDMKKKQDSPQSPSQHEHHDGQHNRMGGGQRPQ